MPSNQASSKSSFLQASTRPHSTFDVFSQACPRRKRRNRWTREPSAPSKEREQETMKLSLIYAAVFAVALFPAAVAAQTPTLEKQAAVAPAPKTFVTADYREQIVLGNQVVEFPDDGIAIGGDDWFGGVILRPPGAVRIGLIRPRANFVPELLKTVENL